MAWILEKVMIYIPGRTEQSGMNSHHITQKTSQFNTYEKFLSGIFHFIIFGLWFTEDN